VDLEGDGVSAVYGGPSLESLDRYFERREGIAAALDHDCPFCRAVAGAKCLDRWDQPTGFVHFSRAQRAGYLTDPYPLAEDDAWRFSVGPPPEPPWVNED